MRISEVLPDSDSNFPELTKHVEGELANPRFLEGMKGIFAATVMMTQHPELLAQSGWELRGAPEVENGSREAVRRFWLPGEGNIITGVASRSRTPETLDVSLRLQAELPGADGEVNWTRLTLGGKAETRKKTGELVGVHPERLTLSHVSGPVTPNSRSIPIVERDFMPTRLSLLGGEELLGVVERTGAYLTSLVKPEN